MNYYAKPAIIVIADHDHRQFAWAVSRPNLVDLKDYRSVDLGKFNTMDLSLAGMRSVTMRIYSSAGFRELLFTLRPYQCWSSTSRVTPLVDIKFPVYLDDERKRDLQYRIYRMLNGICDNVHQDTNRMNLTLGYMSEYVVTIDFRTLVGFIKWLKAKVPLYYNEYGLTIQHQLDINVDDYAYGYPIDESNYSKSESTDIDQTHLPNGWYYLSLPISFAQRAQLVRHVGLTITDKIPEMAINDTLNYEGRGLDESLRVDMIGAKAVFKNMVTKRTCWLAQIPLWENLTLPYIRSASSIAEYLPCNGNGNNCRYVGDMEGRLAGTDPGLVCPVYADDPKLIDSYRSKVQDCEMMDYYAKLWG